MSGATMKSQHVILLLLHQHLCQNSLNIGFGTYFGADKQIYSPYTSMLLQKLFNIITFIQ